jgi:hypothetical protein
MKRPTLELALRHREAASHLNPGIARIRQPVSASTIRQRVRYSMGDMPIVALNFRANVDRDIPGKVQESERYRPYFARDKG